MRFLLDTNTCIYIIKRKPPKVLEKFQTLDISDVGISSITVAELPPQTPGVRTISVPMSTVVIIFTSNEPHQNSSIESIGGRGGTGVHTRRIKRATPYG